MLRRLAIPVWAAFLAALPLPAAEAKPARILSLDFCADQFVLQLADRDRILALSPDSERAFSYLRDAARGLPQVRPTAEEVLLRKPDLVVRSYGGGPNAGAFFARAGLPVLQLGWSGDLESMKHTLREVAAGLGEPERGARLVEEIDARLARSGAAPGAQDRALSDPFRGHHRARHADRRDAAAGGVREFPAAAGLGRAAPRTPRL